jgi:hypothetical protein
MTKPTRLTVPVELVADEVVIDGDTGGFLWTWK